MLNAVYTVGALWWTLKESDTLKAYKYTLSYLFHDITERVMARLIWIIAYQKSAKSFDDATIGGRDEDPFRSKCEVNARCMSDSRGKDEVKLTTVEKLRLPIPTQPRQLLRSKDVSYCTSTRLQGM